MTVTYPKSGLQDSVGFQKNGKPGTYPVQAWNDEIGTFQFASTLAEGSVIPFGAAVLMGNSEDGIRLPVATDIIKQGQTIPAVAATGSLAFSGNVTANDTLTIGSTTYTFVDSDPSTNEIEIGTTLAETIAALAEELNSGEVVKATAGEGKLDLEAATAGVAGNSIATTTTSSVITPSGATLSGGADSSEAAAANASFVGVAVFNYYSTVQAGGYKKQDLDVNVAVKQKGYVTVLMSSLEGADFQKGVTLDLTNPGQFKVAGSGDTVVGKINKIFPDYGTAEIELKEFI